MGQGETLVSPCQLMMWQSAVANGTGVSTKPHLIDTVTNVSGKVTKTASTEYTGQLFSVAAAQETRKIRGGFIMLDGDVEINCAFETLVRLQREKLEKQVAQVLFPE